jgi:hypothetical protein
MIKPLKDEAYYHNLIIDNGIDKPPSFWQVVLPEVFDAVFGGVFMWDDPLRGSERRKRRCVLYCRVLG